MAKRTQKIDKADNTDDAVAAKAFVTITAKIDGFRRAGIVHSGTKTYARDAFDEATLKKLQSEPLLIVEEIQQAELVGDWESLEKPETPTNQENKGAA